MSTNFLSGKQGYVGVATATSVDYGLGTGTAGSTVLMSFGDWRMPLETGTPEVSSFKTAPYRAYVPGLMGATAETDCPGYDYGNMPLTGGNTYFLHLGFNSTGNIELTGLAILKKLEPANKADGAPTIKATWQFTGAVSISIS